MRLLSVSHSAIITGMKIWMKYLLGIILGFTASFILPVASPQLSSAIAFIKEIFTRSVSYIMIPLIFSSTCTAAFKLSQADSFRKTALWTGIIIAASSVLLTLIGLFSILFVKLPRIPISVEKLANVSVLDISSLVRQIFPYSSVQTLSEEFFMLPVFVFAIILGLACSQEETAVSRPIINLSDSLSRVCYLIMNFFLEIFSIGMIAISVSWIVQFRSILAQGIFTPLIIILLCDFIFVAVVVYPLILYFVCHDPRPYRVLYAGLASIFTSFFSGNTNVSLPVIMRHSKDSLGEQRRVTAFSIPLFSIFARGGSALVTVVSFIVIWRSYSTLNITFVDLLWFSAVSFALSFALGNMPVGGTFFALTVLCTMYSRGFESGYLLLRPAAAIIGSFAAAFDAVTTIFGSYFVAIKTKQIRHKELSNFI